MESIQHTKKELNRIAKEAEYSYEYAEDILKGPFPLGEAIIFASKVYKERYIRFLINLQLKALKNRMNNSTHQNF